jgi:hypothetical protein
MYPLAIIGPVPALIATERRLPNDIGNPSTCFFCSWAFSLLAFTAQRAAIYDQRPRASASPPGRSFPTIRHLMNPAR